MPACPQFPIRGSTVRACVDHGIPIEVIPGPSAVLTALVGSGLATDRFYLGGFLPVKSGQREKELKAALAREVTSIYFESPHRIIRSLEAIRNADATRAVAWLANLPSNLKNTVAATSRKFFLTTKHTLPRERSRF